MAQSCSAAVTTGWQQLRLATVLRQAGSPPTSGSFEYCLALALASAKSCVVDCRRRFRRRADTRITSTCGVSGPPMATPPHSSLQWQKPPTPSTLQSA
jgi:hypothetical protein